MTLEHDQDMLFKRLATAAARAADDKKGEEISLLWTHPVTSVANYMLIVNALSPHHINALEESIKKSLKDQGVIAIHRDGQSSDSWRVLDYGGLLVHLMHPSAREFYALDKVFGEAKRVRWSAPVRKPPADAKKKTSRSKRA